MTIIFSIMREIIEQTEELKNKILQLWDSL